jgi:hypothetical protein
VVPVDYQWSRGLQRVACEGRPSQCNETFRVTRSRSFAKNLTDVDMNGTTGIAGNTLQRKIDSQLPPKEPIETGRNQQKRVLSIDAIPFLVRLGKAIQLFNIFQHCSKRNRIDVGGKAC